MSHTALKSIEWMVFAALISPLMSGVLYFNPHDYVPNQRSL